MSKFISYAQNFEDVMLWRALKHIQNGFYVDVGANDPKFDSVTQAFYERGWRGINIEPMQQYYEILCKERSEDINLQVAVAAAIGEIVLFEVPGTGLSSCIAEFAHSAQTLDRVVIERKVPALTLNSILESHAREPINFLKIDIEGFEEQAIRGLDLTRWRPWILVVEATVPNSTEVRYKSWEPLVLSTAYTFVYFDGLNRFYVANEYADLVPSFAVPPNFFDDFITFKEVNDQRHIAWQDTIIQDLNEKLKTFEEIRNKFAAIEESFVVERSERDAIKKELDETRVELNTARKEVNAKRLEKNAIIKELNVARKELDAARVEMDALRVELKWVRGDLSYLRTEIENIRKDRDEIQAHVQHLLTDLSTSRAETESFRLQYINVLNSRSYRITSPLRALYVQAQRFHNRIQNTLRSRQKIEQDHSLLLINSNSNAPELIENDQYFIKFFQREIHKRKKHKRIGNHESSG